MIRHLPIAAPIKTLYNVVYENRHIHQITQHLLERRNVAVSPEPLTAAEFSTHELPKKLSKSPAHIAPPPHKSNTANTCATDWDKRKWAKNMTMFVPDEESCEIKKTGITASISVENVHVLRREVVNVNGISHSLNRFKIQKISVLSTAVINVIHTQCIPTRLRIVCRRHSH